MLKFADDAARPDPHSSTFFSNLINPDTPPSGYGIPATINGFFKKTSNNGFSWIGDVGGVGGVGGAAWITLPKTKTAYAPCGWSGSCFDISTFSSDAVTAAKAQGISFTAYDNVNFVISNDLDCCAWGGGWTIDGKFMGATWEPPWGQETRVYSHEMGHSLGLPHSGWVYYAYDSPWDVMSGYSDLVVTACGSYVSDNDGGRTDTLYCREPGNGYIMAHRDFLGWIPAANQVTLNYNGPGTSVALEGGALPVGTGIKMIKICLPGYSCTGSSSTTRYFTVEARVKNLASTSLYDNGIPNEGVVIHDVYFGRSAISGSCFFNSQSGWAVPIDATPGDYNSSTCTEASGGGLKNAQFNVGNTYTNSTYGFTVKVASRVGSTFNVDVNGGGSGVFTTQISIDAPANGATLPRPFTVSGWAINRNATSGTGVDAVHVYATPTGGSAVFLGVATYGSARSDIGALYGSQFTNSGWSLSNAGASLAAGTYAITAYAHNAMTGTFDMTATVNVTVTVPVSNPFIAVDTPTSGQVVTSAFEVGGWAIDAAAASGTGVDAVTFYVQPQGAAAPGVFIGTGSYGWARGDIGALFGSRFTNSGFHFTITGMSPGTFTLNVVAHSTVTSSNSIVKSVPFTVSATALMSIDVPSAESVIASNSITLAGWSIDRSVESVSASGTGVDAVHVYAFPNPGSGQAAIFLGLATLGVSRPDVGGVYGARYNGAGYTITIDRAARGLTAGTYNLVAIAHSSVSNSFNNVALIRVVLQ